MLKKNLVLQFGNGRYTCTLTLLYRKGHDSIYVSDTNSLYHFSHEYTDEDYFLGYIPERKCNRNVK